MDRERDVERYLRRKMYGLGIDCVKYVPDQLPGMPDRMLLLPQGRVAWVELKTTGGRLSEIQKYRHAWLKGIGHTVYVVWNKEQVDALADMIKAGE